jgi:hypothetical protein
MPDPPTIIASAATVCQGTDVVFTVSSPESGATYVWTGTAGTASGAGSYIFTVSGASTGTKSKSATARLASSGTTCQSANAATVTAVVNLQPTITRSGGSATQTVIQNTPITTIRYTATNSATFTLSGGFPTGVSGDADGSSYIISGTPTALGTYGYSLTASNGCPSAAAAGTITVIELPKTLCTQCCWNGDSNTWVDCYVTTNAYPFNNAAASTELTWSGNGTTYYEGASGTLTHYSDRDGRVNTANIPSSTTTVNAVQICKNLGTGWYLPAYEELVNMSDGTENSPLNGRADANLLATPLGSYWSSTERYNNRGRLSGNSDAQKIDAVRVYYNGRLDGGWKSNPYNVRCAWRE